MATARKCDICGRLYEYYDDTDNYIEIGKLYLNRDLAKRVTFDMCRECNKAITATISKLKEDEQ